MAQDLWSLYQQELARNRVAGTGMSQYDYGEGGVPVWGRPGEEGGFQALGEDQREAFLRSIEPPSKSSFLSSKGYLSAGDSDSFLSPRALERIKSFYGLPTLRSVYEKYNPGGTYINDPNFGEIYKENPAGGYNRLKFPEENPSGIKGFLKSPVAPFFLAGGLGAAGAFGGAGGAGSATAGGATAGAPVFDAVLSSLGPGATAADVAAFLGAGGALGGAGGVGAPVIEAGRAASAADIARLGAPSGLAGTALSRILAGTPGTGDLLSLLGTAGATALGLVGAKKQTGALQDIFNRFEAKGAPSLARFEGSFAPGFSIWDDAATRDAAARAADISARSYSARVGNPFDSPTAMAGIYGDVLKGVALPQLNTYRSQNLSGAGMGANIAGTAGLAGAEAARSPFATLAGALGDLTTPRSSLEELLARVNRNTLMVGGSRII